MKVMKFGGSVLHHEAGFQAMVDIVKSHKGKHIIVISAFADITRRLNTMMNLALHDSYVNAVHEMNSIIQYHLMLTDLLLPDNPIFQEKVQNVTVLLQRLLKGISLTKEISPRISDLILSQGEILATCFVTQLFTAHKINVGFIEASDIIITNDDHGFAKPIESLISQHIHTTLLPALDLYDHIVIAGFIGKNTSNNITTMGYESSNLTAALLGSILNAEEIIIWTDVCGIRSSDPKYISNTKGIPQLSYKQAQELADNGLKLLHHWMLDLPLKNSIPLSIANAFDDKGEKTSISNLYDIDIPTIIIHNSQVSISYSYIFTEDLNSLVQISIFTQSDSIIQKIYELATEVYRNNKVIVKTFESDTMHHVILDNKNAQYFMNSLHSLIGN
jgi:aspartate kinase